MFNSLTTTLCLFGLSYGYISEDTTLTETDTYADRDDSDNSTTYCYGYKECDSDTIDTDYVYCGGYYGCYEADIGVAKIAYADGLRGGQEADIYSGDDIFCGGYIGCFMATIWSKGDTICDGHSSCWHAELVSDNDIFLLGYRAAGASEIYGGSKSTTLYSFGPSSTIYSVISKVSTIINLGYAGLYYADIDTDYVQELNVYSMGRMGSNYAQIYCRSGSTCNIFCRDYGCYGLEIRCYKGAKCKYTLYDSSCDSSPTLLYSKDEDDDAAFDTLFETRKEAKLLAKQEMLKYSKLDYTVNELEEIFDKKIENAFASMNLIDGKLPENERQYTTINTELIDTTESNIVYTSEYAQFVQSHKHGENEGLDIDTLCTVGGVIAGLLVLFGGHRFMNKKKMEEDILRQSRYQYQSI